MNISDLIEELADIVISYIESRDDFCEKDSQFIDAIYELESKLREYKKLDKRESR